MLWVENMEMERDINSKTESIPDPTVPTGLYYLLILLGDHTLASLINKLQLELIWLKSKVIPSYNFPSPPFKM